MRAFEEDQMALAKHWCAERMGGRAPMEGFVDRKAAFDGGGKAPRLECASTWMTARLETHSERRVPGALDVAK